MPSEKTFNIFLALVRPLKGKGLGSIRPVNQLYRWLEGQLLPRSSRLVSVNGCTMKLVATSIDGIERQLIFSKEYEPVATNVLKKFVQPGMRVVDVGANIGYYTLLLSKLVKENGTVWSFEPEAKNFDNLTTNIRLNRLTNVISVPKAVGSKNEIRDFFISSEESGEHSIVLKRHCKKVVRIRVVSLDSVIVDKIDVLKTDTEGNDCEVLLGAKELIRKYRPLLITEFWPDGLIKAGAKPQDFWILLQSYYDNIYIADEVEKTLSIGTMEDAVRRIGKNMLSVNLICSKESLL